MATILKAGNVATGAQITSDSTGILEIKTGTGAGTTAITVGTDQAVAIGGNNISAVNSLGFRNRIINGDMRIDQRNAGASVTVNGTGAQYCVDRWYGQGQTTDGVFTLQQTSDGPSGYQKSLKVTVTTADSSIGANQVYRLIQRIEGFNVGDFGLGTSGAVPFTISFWVKSSVTGTFGGSLWGAGATEWYVFSYTINSANTWEYKTVTVSARTSGSFDTTNGIGLQLQFSLGAGSSRLTTAGSWITGATEYYGVTGQTNLISTLNATFYITGVQLEAGSVATPFERRDYGRELAMAQRYFQLNIPTLGWSTSTTNVAANISGSVLMRSAPTAALFNGANGIGDFGVSYRNITAITALGNTDVYGGEINMTPATSTTANKGQGIRGSAIGLSAEL